MNYLFSISLSDVITPLWLSLQVAVCATLFATILGIACGLFMARKNFKGKEVVDAILVLPMVMPPTVLGYYLIVVLGRNSAIGAWFERTFNVVFMFTLTGAIVAATVVAFPLVYKSARAAFEEISQECVESAQNLGANGWQVFWRISLPLALRGTMAGVMLALARSLGEFGATLMIAGSRPGKTQTLSLAIYQAVQDGKDTQALLLTLIICVMCVAVLVSISVLLRRKGSADLVV